MTEPYDPQAELTNLARWIDLQLGSETASRQHIAEYAAGRIAAVVYAMSTAHEAAARRAAATPPVGSEEEAEALPAVVAAREAYAAVPGPGRMAPHSRLVLTGALEAAGVTLGGFDRFIIDWLAGVNIGTCAVVAGWVTRAAAHEGRAVAAQAIEADAGDLADVADAEAAMAEPGEPIPLEDLQAEFGDEDGQ